MCTTCVCVYAQFFALLRFVVIWWLCSQLDYWKVYYVNRKWCVLYVKGWAFRVLCCNHKFNVEMFPANANLITTAVHSRVSFDATKWPFLLWRLLLIFTHWCSLLYVPFPFFSLLYHRFFYSDYAFALQWKNDLMTTDIYSKPQPY